jgi:flagellar biosynthesis protein FlhA
MASTAVLNGARQLAYTGIGTPVLLMLVLSMMVVPLPPFALDILFTFNISLSLVVLMSGVYAKRPLDFAAFPTVLLVTTLLRLALNVASTRVVLLDGHTGTGAAGKVIEAFGAFVIGGNYAVGLVVFSILVIINFVVVTKGAGRVSEVSARFTLDALPGKQMAIDADLNAGLITQDEARERRSEVAAEADFYGSMDGASKFVRGDAIAGILILVINVLGGLSIGMLQHGLEFGRAMHNYTLLTIGDGLVAQIPSLLLSTAAAIMVTRVSSAQDMRQQIVAQMFANPRVLAVTAGIIGTMGLVPGMPNLSFLLLAAIAGGGAWWLARRPEESVAQEPEVAAVEPAREPAEVGWEDVPAVDPLGLEVGYRLIPMVDTGQGGQLMSRIKGVRKKASQELGFLVPAVHIRDNLELPPNGYRLSVMGVPVGEGEIQPELELAINPGEVFGELPGEPGRDPVFGLEATWVDRGRRDEAQALGYTVVDCETVVATHLSQVVNDHAHLLLGHQETQELLERLGRVHPKLVEDLVPKTLPLGVVVRVLQNLLRERIPVRDMRTIAEVLAETGFITQHLFGLKEEIAVATLDPSLDQLLHQTLHAAALHGAALQGAAGGEGGLEPGLAERLLGSLGEVAQRCDLAGESAVLLVADALRPMFARLVKQGVPGMHVLAYGEVPENRNLRIVATVGGEMAMPGPAA